MGYEIGPLREGEIEALSRFLIAGFRAAPGSRFASPELLRWKYLAARGEANELLPRSMVARDEEGAIVGHVGFALSRFMVAERPGVAPEVRSAVHMMDWLVGPGHKGVGGALMRRVHGLAEIPYGFGGSAAGRAVIKGGGYTPRPCVPVYRLTLRPGHAWRDPNGGSVAARAARSAREWGRLLLGFRRDRERSRAWRSEFTRISLVDSVEPADDAELVGACAPMVGLIATPQVRAALLSCPGVIARCVSIERMGERLGWGIMSVCPDGRARVGKIVDACLATRDEAIWAAVMRHFVAWLAAQRADVAFACGATPWEADALRAAGFHRVYDLEFSIRDRRAFLPTGLPTHVSFQESDYSYMP